MKIKDKIYKIVLLILFSSLWEIGARIFKIPILPAPSQLLAGFFSGQIGVLCIHLLFSIKRILIGLLVGIFLGFFCGIWLGLSEKWDRRCAFLLYITYSFPKVLLIPILVIFFGAGEFSKILVVTISVFYQIVMQARSAAKAIPKDYFTVMQILGGGSRATFFHVVLPAVAAQMTAGVRISFGTAVAMLFFTETYATNEGIGFYVWDHFSRFDFIQVYNASIFLCAISYIFFKIIDLIDAKLFAWR